MRQVQLILTAVVLALLSVQTGYSHSGRTDKNGGHYDRKNGGYHYHNGGKKSSPKSTYNSDEAERQRKAEEAERKRIREQEAQEREEERLRLEAERKRQEQEAEAEQVRWEAAHNYQDLTQHREVYQTPSHLREIYKVVDVIDGDTIEVDFDGDVATVRLIGVDTPETVHPNQPVEEYGKEASYFLKNLLLDEWIWLDTPSEGATNTDKYGRLLGYAYRYPDGMFVNLEVIRQGYGHAYVTYPFQYMEDFQFYEAKAREAGRGLWGDFKGDRFNASLEPAPFSTSTSTKVSYSRPNLGLQQSYSSTKSGADVTVYITKTGAKYHNDGCNSLRKSKIAVTLKEAKERGYGACKNCDPPS
jgi:micrococcal nuclease